MDTTQWFYLKEGQQRGPIDTGDMACLLQSGTLSRETPVWNASQADWLPAHATRSFSQIQPIPRNSTSRRLLVVLLLLLLLALWFGAEWWGNRQVAPMTASDAKEIPELRGKFHVSQPRIPDKPTVASKFETAAFCDEKQNQAKANLAKAEHNLQRMAAGNAALQQHINQLQQENQSLETQRLAAENKARQFEALMAASDRRAKDSKKRAETAQRNETRFDSQLQNANLARQQLEMQLTELRDYNTKLARRLVALEKTSRQSKAAPASNPKETAALKREIANLIRSNTELRRRLQSAPPQPSTNTPQQITQLTSELQEATAELEAAQQRISSLEQQLPNRPALAESQPPLPSIPESQNVSSTLGRITSVDRQRGLIILNGGVDNGIREGQQYRIIGRSSGEFIGRITIRRAQPTVAIGTLDGLGLNRLQPGDRVVR